MWVRVAPELGLHTPFSRRSPPPMLLLLVFMLLHFVGYCLMMFFMLWSCCRIPKIVSPLRQTFFINQHLSFACGGLRELMGFSRSVFLTFASVTTFTHFFTIWLYLLHINFCLMFHLFRRDFCRKNDFKEIIFKKNIFYRKHFRCLARTENYKYFLYFHSIILTYKN